MRTFRTPGMGPSAPELCHCGEPLHYSDPQAEKIMRRMVETLGPLQKITHNGRSWLVPRHYTALHGIRPKDLPTLGFEEVTDGNG